jgi:hypothetical protein
MFGWVVRASFSALAAASSNEMRRGREGANERHKTHRTTRLNDRRLDQAVAVSGRGYERRRKTGLSKKLPRLPRPTVFHAPEPVGPT